MSTKIVNELRLFFFQKENEVLRRKLAFNL